MEMKCTACVAHEDFFFFFFKVSHRAALVSIVSFGKNATCAQRDSLRCSRPRVTFSFCLDLDDVMKINSQCMYAFHLSD